MSLINEEFFKEEKKSFRASMVYRRIKLLESVTFQYVMRFFVLYNIIMIIIIKTIQPENESIFLLKDKLYILIGEIILASSIVGLLGKSEWKFNRLLKNGIALKTTIVQNLSWVVKGGNNPALRIYSYYICKEGTKLVFEQVKVHHPYNKIFYINTTYGLEKKLRKEEYITVIVNPEKCNEYEILIDEIGVEAEDKKEVLYAKKSGNIVFLILLILEYIMFVFM